MGRKAYKFHCLLFLMCAGGLFLWSVLLSIHEDSATQYPEKKEVISPSFHRQSAGKGEKAPHPSFSLQKEHEEDEEEEVEKHDDDDDDDDDEYTDMERPRVWVLMGSMARSGTSLLGELISQFKPSIYFFEPELSVKILTKAKVTRETGMPFLHDVAKCKFNETFIKWLYTRSKGNVVHHHMTHRCHTPAQCFSVTSLTEACLSEQLRIMKIIRIRMRWMRDLLSDSKIDLKLVHISRDPRASLRSIVTHHITKLEPEKFCSAMEDDLEQCKQLEDEFPGQIMRLQYEQFCIDPEGQAMRLWRFLSGNQTATLPPSWTTFLDRHTHLKPGRRGAVFGTVRDTRHEYDEWRWEINENILAAVEEPCTAVINRLGHRLFGSISVARNASVPLAADGKK